MQHLNIFNRFIGPEREAKKDTDAIANNLAISQAFQVVHKQMTQLRYRILSITQISPTEIFVDMFKSGHIVSIEDPSKVIHTIDSKQPFRYVIKVEQKRATSEDLLVCGMENGLIHVHLINRRIAHVGPQ